MKPLPPEHFGTQLKRTWFKVRWNEHANQNLVGKLDLLTQEQLDRQKNYAEVLVSIEVEKCVGGTPMGFGKWGEEKVEDWIRLNRK